MTDSRTYKTPAAFDRALKKAVRESGAEAGAGYRQALRDRFLCRVFSAGNDRFVLKGGSGMLARVPDARSTRDLDFAAQSMGSAREALAEMERIASVDLGDWCRFALTKCEESLDDNGYSRLLRLRFSTYVGSEEKDPVLIDLSLDCELTMPPDVVTPANRVDIAGVPVCDYLVYHVADQLADKLCAIMEIQPGGYPSSRMKDLADVVAYASTQEVSSEELRRAIECECGRRSMAVPARFEAPAGWQERYASFAKGIGAPERYRSFGAATALASSFFDPVLSGSSSNAMTWDPATLMWSRAERG